MDKNRQRSRPPKWFCSLCAIFFLLCEIFTQQEIAQHLSCVFCRLAVALCVSCISALAYLGSTLRAPSTCLEWFESNVLNLLMLPVTLSPSMSQIDRVRYTSTPFRIDEWNREDWRLHDSREVFLVWSLRYLPSTRVQRTLIPLCGTMWHPKLSTW